MLERTRVHVEVRLVRRQSSLHRLVGLLGRKGIEVVRLTYGQDEEVDLAVLELLVVAGRTGHAIESMRREVDVVTVEVVDC